MWNFQFTLSEENGLQCVALSGAFSEAKEDPGSSIRLCTYVFYCGILPEVELKGMDNTKFHEQS